MTAVLLGAGLLQFAPAHAADFSNSRIPVIVKATTSQYWATVFDGADAAAKTLGVQISKLGATAETDVAGEVSIMENAISSKPAAIVIAATNAAALAHPI
jgi:ribose transport system substrate-binding protein